MMDEKPSLSACTLEMLSQPGSTIEKFFIIMMQSDPDLLDSLKVGQTAASVQHLEKNVNK